MAQKRPNSFDKNIKFTANTFVDGKIHFLGTEIVKKTTTNVYHKPTNTDQYINFHSHAMDLKNNMGQIAISPGKTNLR